MKYDDDLEKRLTAIFGIVGTFAILLGIGVKGVNYENILDAIKDISGLVISVAVFLVASAIGRRSRSFLDVAESALVKLQRKNQDLLEGPRFDKSDYVPSETEKTKRIKYLFFAPQSWNKKVAFIPLDPLEDGILDIRVSKATLVNLGYSSADASDEKIALAQQSVSETVEKYLKNYENTYQIIYSKSSANEATSASSRYSNSAIIVDFDEENLGMKKFERVIFGCGQEALQSILKFRQ